MKGDNSDKSDNIGCVVGKNEGNIQLYRVYRIYLVIIHLFGSL